MRKNNVLAKIRAGQPARLAMMGYFLPPFIAFAAHYGFDGIWLDLEHHNFDRREVQSLLAFFHLYDIDCYVRPATREKAELYRFLEDGATGLMMPMVNSAAEARQLVDAVKFPPLGGRGLDGTGLDTDYGMADRDAYPEAANRETFLVVQIETPEAVARADEIAAVDGVEGLFIGPGDLGLRLKHDPQGLLDMPNAVAQVSTAAAAHGKAWGQPAFSTEHLRQLVAQGARIIAHGGEYAAIKVMLEERGREWREVLSE